MADNGQYRQGFSLTFLKPNSSIITPFPIMKHPEACRFPAGFINANPMLGGRFA
jgi:hypothetical protein